MTEVAEQEERIVIKLVDMNVERSDNQTCNDGITCTGVICGLCPLNYNKATLGDIRKTDPRNNVSGCQRSADDTGGECQPEYNGGSSDYYQVSIKSTTTAGRPEYIAECNDIIEALGMNFAEGNAFKALWRRAAQRTLGKRKAGAKDDGLYDAQKVEFFGARLVAQSKGLSDETE